MPTCTRDTVCHAHMHPCTHVPCTHAHACKCTHLHVQVHTPARAHVHTCTTSTCSHQTCESKRHIHDSLRSTRTGLNKIASNNQIKIFTQTSLHYWDSNGVLATCHQLRDLNEALIISIFQMKTATPTQMVGRRWWGKLEGGISQTQHISETAR